jgi:flagellar motor switch protein FliN
LVAARCLRENPAQAARGDLTIPMSCQVFFCIFSKIFYGAGMSLASAADRECLNFRLMNELDMILDIPVQLAVELGRTRITIKNLLQLAHGSVVELDAMAGEPLNVFVNGTLIAQGEVVVVNDKFGIRLTDIVTPAERARKIGH